MSRTVSKSRRVSVVDKLLGTSSPDSPGSAESLSGFKLFPGADVCPSCRLSGTVGGFGLDYLPASVSSTASDTSWHQAGSTGSSWTNQESPMEESSSTVLLDSLKVRERPVLDTLKALFCRTDY